MGIEEILKKLTKAPGENKMILILLLLVLGLALLFLPKLLLTGNTQQTTQKETSLEEATQKAVCALDNVTNAEVIINYETADENEKASADNLSETNDTDTQQSTQIRSVVVIVDNKIDKNTEYQITQTVKTSTDVPAHKIIVLTKKE